MKYIDPGYQIRASVTTASDSIYCERLGNNDVAAARERMRLMVEEAKMKPSEKTKK
ncbi:MAG: hypothetical protein K6E78_06535 [Treponema sp.]|nr:hypothetical protein [Treponema sp.]